MKAVIFAGGFGTRLTELTYEKPKPMVEIGEWPILVHIMDIFADDGITDFVVLLGYKGGMIKKFFADFALLCSDCQVDLASGEVLISKRNRRDWNIQLVDTGLHTMTGGRVLRAKQYLEGEEFFLTYGDGLCSVRMTEVLDHHRSMNALVTLTAVAKSERFGIVEVNGGIVSAFEEKPKSETEMINGGFFVVSPEIFSRIDNDQSVWEKNVLEKVCAEKRLAAHIHTGFFQPMDSARDLQVLESMVRDGKYPWRK